MVNELTAQTNTGKLTVVGTTTSSATNVTVNGTNAAFYGDSTFAASGMPFSNSYTAIGKDVYGRRSTNTVAVSLTTNSTFLYDGNGNLTNDGLRNFVYDDENQLIQVLVSNQRMSQFQYDGKMRRRVRKEFTWTNSAWAQTNLVYYVYDGNLVIQERNANNLPTVTFTRGKDMSGSLDGAGGIGGLLARTDATLGQAAYYHADANGNVTMLVNSTNAIVGKYLYDAFGNVLSQSGPLAAANLYRFSSKEAHLPSGLDYYLYRYYDPNLQRWPNRDPIGQLGVQLLSGMLQENLLLSDFLFCQNNPIDRYDGLGLDDVPGAGTFLGAGAVGGFLEIYKTLKVCSTLKNGESVLIMTPASALANLSPAMIMLLQCHCRPYGGIWLTLISKDPYGGCHWGGPVAVCNGSPNSG